jgi:hypothetical protein
MPLWLTISQLSIAENSLLLPKWQPAVGWNGAVSSNLLASLALWGRGAKGQMLRNTSKEEKGLCYWFCHVVFAINFYWPSFNPEKKTESILIFVDDRRSISITGWRMLRIGLLVALVSGVHHYQFGLVMMRRRWL